MADIDEKRIAFVSDTDVSVPIRWSANATDIKWNNAIVLATTIARTIDRMNLWDGYLHFREKTGYFKINTFILNTSEINDELDLHAENPVSLSFNEDVPYHRIVPAVLMTSNIATSFPNSPYQAYCIDNTTIYVEMANPIYSNDVSANINAFEITATFGGIQYTTNPVNVTLNDTSGITLTVDDLSQVVGEVNVLYKSEMGNLMDSMNNVKIDSFNKGFTYSTTYSEGE